MKGQRIGYARISDKEFSSERQLENSHVDRKFVDTVSGKEIHRPERDALFAAVSRGDTVVVYSMDRLARNLDELGKLVRDLTGRGIRIEFIKEELTFGGDDSPMGNVLLSAMGAFAEFERALIRERQREGIELAKKRGVYKGRKKSLNPKQVAELRKRAAAGEQKTAIARFFGISRETVYQYLKNEPRVIKPDLTSKPDRTAKLDRAAKPDRKKTERAKPEHEIPDSLNTEKVAERKKPIQLSLFDSFD